MKNDYYVLVDYNLKQFIDHIKKLPENWRNISGLPNYSDEKLKELTWAGHSNQGWINISSPEILNFNYTNEWLEINKNNIKASVSEDRKEAQSEVLCYNDHYIISDEATRLNLAIKKVFSEHQDKQIYWKFIDGYQSISPKDVDNLFIFLETYVQKCFDEEARLFSEIDNITNLSQLLSLKLTPNWPKTNYDL
jgi:hypothetical protein